MKTFNNHWTTNLKETRKIRRSNLKSSTCQKITWTKTDWRWILKYMTNCILRILCQVRATSIKSLSLVSSSNECSWFIKINSKSLSLQTLKEMQKNWKCVFRIKIHELTSKHKSLAIRMNIWWVLSWDKCN